LIAPPSGTSDDTFGDQGFERRNAPWIPAFAAQLDLRRAAPLEAARCDVTASTP